MAALVRFFGSTRPIPGETANGDGWTVFDTHTGQRVALIDGAGHGPLAEEARLVAIESLQQTSHLSLADSLKRCHEVLRGTRGAVISMLELSETAIEFTGVGNVEGRLYGGEKVAHFAPRRGILGTVIPTLRPEYWDLPPAWAVVMFTDGISQRLADTLNPLSIDGDSQTFTDQLVQTWGRQTDDATIVLVLSD
jgi:phosphoserine phosphatase RsbX